MDFADARHSAQKRSVKTLTLWKPIDHVSKRSRRKYIEEFQVGGRFIADAMFGVTRDEDGRAGLHRRLLAVDLDDAGSLEDEVNFRWVVAMRLEFAARGEVRDAGAHAVGGGDVAAQQRVPGDEAMDGIVPSVAWAFFRSGNNSL